MPSGVYKRKQIDITGQKFNRLTAIRFVKSINRQPYWLFRCVCGKKKIINKYSVINGKTKSCCCLMTKTVAGVKTNKLTTIKFIEKRRKKYYWLFKCDCGKEKIINKGNVVMGIIKSCGCLKLTHNMSKTRFYTIWKLMKLRCSSKKIIYKNYNGRGIKVCKEWLKFENFRDDMYQPYLESIKKYGEKNTTINRMNNDDNYCKKNCRWATYKEQANNR